MKKQLIKPTFDLETLITYLRDNSLTLDIKGNDILVPFNTLVEEQTKELIEPQIFITTEAYIKMNYLVQKENQEIAWHGVVEAHPTLGNYLITDILVYPQIVASTTVDSDVDEYPKWIFKHREILNSIRMQGHSHVNMACSPSGVDTNYYEELIEHVEDYYIFMIFNKKQDFHIRFYDMDNNLLYTDLPLYIYSEKESFSLDEFYQTSKKMFTDKAKPMYQTPYEKSQAEKERIARDRAIIDAKEKAANEKKNQTSKPKAKPKSRKPRKNSTKPT